METVQSASLPHSTLRSYSTRNTFWENSEQEFSLSVDLYSFSDVEEIFICKQLLCLGSRPFKHLDERLKNTRNLLFYYFKIGYTFIKLLQFKSNLYFKNLFGGLGA